MQTLKLFVVMLVGIISLPFSAVEASPHTPKIEASGDTVVIKFGENSRLELHIANEKDRKVLSELDLNELVDKINAYMSSENSTIEQPVYSEAHPAENAELIASQNMQATITAVHPTPTKKTPTPEKVDCDDKDLKLVWNFDFGFNNYLQNGRAASAIEQDLNNWRSNYFAISTHLKKKVSQKANLKIGVEMAWNSLSFAENTVLEHTEQGTTFSVDTFSVDKSKLNISYLSLPLMLEFQGTKRWTFGVGGHVGYRVGTHTKRTYRTEGVNKTEKSYGNFGLSDFRYGLRSELGYNGWRLFMNYDLNTLFTGSSPDLQLVSFGVRM